MLHNIIAVTGPFGSGKTLYAFQLGVDMAAKFKKPLVVNFDVDEKALREYCRFKGYKWWASNGRIIRVELMNNLMHVWDRQNCVFVFDEAGVFSNSRSWKSTPKEFLQNLFQIRHLDIHLIIIFQFFEQIDKQLREVVQCWIKCSSLGFYSNELRMPKIVYRRALWYEPEKFLRLEMDAQARGSIIRPLLWASRHYVRFLAIAGFFNELYNAFIVITYYLRKSLYPKSLIMRPKMRYTLEAHLFSCFSSKAVVGELPSVHSTPKFYTEVDFVEWERFH